MAIPKQRAQKLNHHSLCDLWPCADERVVVYMGSASQRVHRSISPCSQLAEIPDV